ncbi:MAG: glycosyltransferase family 2 protein [Bacteroidales bacterium]|nr:glycosyltransferase family 2 protein [Bacteroidales bacterium]
MQQRKACVLIPTYNNGGTLRDVVERVLPFCADVIVVNDGCTDHSAEVLASFGERITVVDYGRNRGKGYALKQGFRKAKSKGFDYALTLDSDGQHFPEDIPLFVNALEKHPNALIVGSRNLNQENMPGGNTFANKFSNFWFKVQTGIDLPDTQTGYRLYTLRNMSGLALLTSRYEAELELLVFSAWRGIDLIPIKINVFYPKGEERVSHFRPFWDFFRISVLNTVLCVVALVYGWPSRLIRKTRRPHE